MFRAPSPASRCPPTPPAPNLDLATLDSGCQGCLVCLYNMICGTPHFPCPIPTRPHTPPCWLCPAPETPPATAGVPGQQHKGPAGLQRYAGLPHLPNEIWFHFKSQSCQKKSQREDQAFSLETFLPNTKTLELGCAQLKRKDRPRYLREVTHEYFPQNKWF